MNQAIDDVQQPRAAMTRPSASAAWTALALLITAVLLAFIDRQLLALLAEPVRMALDLSDTRLGLLQGPAFAVFYVLAALPLGWLVDRSHRIRLVAAGIALWSISTALSGFAPDFQMLFACRVGVGVGEACLYPAVYSLIPDYFRKDRQATAFGVYVAVVLFGASGALTAGGAAIVALERLNLDLPGLGETWRFAFVAMGAPGLLLALVFLRLPEPARQGPEAERASITPDGITRVISWPTLAGAALGIAAASALVQTALAWTPTALVRGYGFTVGQAGIQLGWAVGAASLLAGGCVAFAPRLATRLDPAHPALTASLAAAVLVVPGAILLGAASNPVALTMAFAVLFTPACVAYGLSPVLVQALTPNRFRGRAVAVLKAVEHGAVALCVLAVGIMSDAMAKGDASSARSGLQSATASVLLAAALLAVVFYAVARWAAYPARCRGMQ